MTGTTRYEDDVVAWAEEQRRLLRERRFDLLEIPHLPEEIEDVGKSEQRELVSRMAVLLTHLLNWQLHCGRRGAGWQFTIRNQRRGIARRREEPPSLRPKREDTGWWTTVWDDATARVAQRGRALRVPGNLPLATLTKSWIRGGYPNNSHVPEGGFLKGLCASGSASSEINCSPLPPALDSPNADQLAAPNGHRTKRTGAPCKDNDRTPRLSASNPLGRGPFPT